jgi:predicted RNA methylase
MSEQIALFETLAAVCKPQPVKVMEEITNVQTGARFPVAVHYGSNTEVAKRHALAAKCRDSADWLQRDIDRKNESWRNMLAKPPTRKRTQDAERIRKDAIRLEKFQKLLRMLADRHEAGTIAPELAKITTRGAVENAYWKDGTELRRLYDSLTVEQTREQKLLQAERDIILAKISGFFATPNEYALQLADLLGPIVPNGKVPNVVLEPGAGTGRLIDAVLTRQPGASIAYCEINPRLRRYLEEKYQGRDRMLCLASDFEECSPTSIPAGFKWVLMNPPFERRQDADHVCLAWELLAPGGKLAAIVGEGLFYGHDRKAEAFRALFDEYADREYKLPPGAFKEFGTDVNARIIRMVKPE